MTIFLSPMLILQSFGKSTFDRKPLEELQTVIPDYVFVGNSMLYSRIDSEHLSQLTGGKKIVQLKVPGGRSAHWFLVLKNYIVAAGVIPKTVFIFFRNTTLTSPTARTRGQGRVWIEKLSLNHEPLYNKVLKQNQSIRTKLDIWLERVYPIQNYRDKAERTIRRLAMAPFIPNDFKQLLRRIIFGSLPDKENEQIQFRRKDFFTKINSIFSLNNQKTIDEPNFGLFQSRQTQDSFADQASRSFLPHIISLAKDKYINLVFVRTQERPLKNGPPPQSEKLKTYIQELRAYIERYGFVFHDFTGDSRITLSLYRHGDHIAEKHMPYYTEIFYNTLFETF